MKHPAIDPRIELGELDALVCDSLARIRDGLAVDLGDLDSRTERLCEYLLALPALEARPYAGRLEALIGAMDTLEQEIAGRLGSLAPGVEGQPGVAAAE